MDSIKDFKISIILPCFNGEKYLSQSIESCLNQTHSNIELIIVNDCSSDSTLEITNRYAATDNRIIIINNKVNKKLPASLNIGHQIATGDFITWTSDDNRYELNALGELLKELLKENVDVVYSDFILIDKYGNKIRDVKLTNIENLIFGNFIGTCFLYKKEVFERNKCYDESLFLLEDYDFWLQAISHSSFYHLKKKLYQYRKHSESLTNQIFIDNARIQLYNNNASVMFNKFGKSILISVDYGMATLQTKIFTNQNIDFEWFVKNDSEIRKIINTLYKNTFFGNKKLIKRVFLKKTIESMISDQKYKNNFQKSMFILNKYFSVIDKNSFKTLVKYSFFNK